MNYKPMWVYMTQGPISGENFTESSSHSERQQRDDLLKKINEMIANAIELAKSIDDTEHRNSSLLLMVNTLARANMIDRAYEVTREISDEVTLSHALIDIADNLVDSGDVERADKVLKEALNVVRSQSEGSRTTWALCGIAKVLVKIGRVDDAVKVTRDIPDPFDRNIALRDVALILVKSQRVHEVNRVLEEALKIAKTIKENSRREMALVSLVEVYREIGMIERAKEILAEAYKSAKKTKGVVRADCLAEVAVEYVEIGSLTTAGKIVEEALNSAYDVTEEPYHSMALRKVAWALFKVKGLEAALEMAQRIPDKNYRSYAMGDIVKGLLESGDVKRAIDIAESIYETRGRTEALLRVAEALVENGDLHRAKEVVHKALVTAKKIREDSERDDVLVDLAKIYAMVGDTKTALMIASEIHDMLDRSRALKHVVEVLAKDKSFEEALSIAMKIPDRLSKVFALASIIEEMIMSLGIVLSINISRTVITESDDLEIEIGSSHPLENVVIEFEGVRAEPVTIEKLRNEIIKIKPDFKPGRRAIKVKVTYDHKEKRHMVEKEFEIEFKPSRRDEQVEKRRREERFLDYVLVRLVGSGAFADVYEARDENGKVVALKIYRGSEQSFIEEIGNFVQMAKKLHGIPYVVRPLRYGVNPKPYIVMDLYPMTLRDLMGRDIELKKKLRLMHRVAKVLAYAHSQKIYHGDLKPENILISMENDEYYPAIADWGGGFTPGYSAPEVYKSGGRYVSEKSDVYSFGVMLYELVTGERLFMDPLDYHARCKIVRIKYRDRRLEEIINACLAPEDKRPGMAEVTDMIAKYILVDLGSRVSMGIGARDALEILNAYLDAGETGIAGERLIVAKNLFSQEVFLIFEKIIDLMKTVYEYKLNNNIIPSDLIESKYRGIIDLLDEEISRVIQQDKFSLESYLQLPSIPPELSDSLIISITRMKDIVFAKYMKELR